jgi:hypothetical protein
MGAQCRALRNLELNLSLDAEFPEPRAVSFPVTLFVSGEAWFAGVVRDGGMPGPLEQALFEELDTHLRALTEHHEAMEFRRAAAETRAIWAAGNQYLQRAAPWSAISTDAPAAARSLRTALNLACLAARISAPFLPHTAQMILDAFGVADSPLRWPAMPAAALLDELPRARRSHTCRCCSAGSRRSRSPTAPRALVARSERPKSG